MFFPELMMEGAKVRHVSLLSHLCSELQTCSNHQVAGKDQVLTLKSQTK